MTRMGEREIGAVSVRETPGYKCGSVGVYAGKRKSTDCISLSFTTLVTND